MKKTNLITDWKLVTVPHKEVKNGFDAKTISELENSNKKIITAYCKFSCYGVIIFSHFQFH